MTPSGKALVVLTTVATDEQARTLARALVERRLAACVNVIGSVRSFYRWEGRIAEEGERLLVIKTAPERYAQLEAAIAELHPYDLPELVALPVVAGAPGYLAWLAESVAEGP